MFSKKTQDSVKVTLILFTDISKDHPDIEIKVNGFSKSVDPFNIYRTVLKGGNNSVEIPTGSMVFKGMGEIVLKGYGSTPIVFYSKLPDTIFITKRELQQMSVPDSGTHSDDLRSLSFFLRLYRGYENMLAEESIKLQAQTADSMKKKQTLNNFIDRYLSYREKFNLFFNYAGKHWPHTYVADVLPSIFKFNLPDKGEPLSIDYIREHYFESWQYNTPMVLYSPLLMRQLDLYMSYFGVDDHGKITEAIDAINKPLLGSTDKSVKDFIHEYFLVAMMSKSRDNNMDENLKYLFDNYLELDICDESATSADEISRNNFYKRLRNIPSVQEGKVFPTVAGNTIQGNALTLSECLNKKKYTLVLIWSSTCSHCEAFKPQIESFAKSHPGNFQVYAVSIDKQTSHNKWEEILQTRKSISNWIDVIDEEGKHLNNIYYMGTPSVFVLDNTGKIITRSLQPENWERILQPLNN